MAAYGEIPMAAVSLGSPRDRGVEAPVTKTIVKSPTPRPLFEPDELYGPDEIATRLKSTERQVRRWIDERRFCAGGVVQLPRGRRVFGFALNEFVAERARSFKA